jgi:hypothetical protein
MAPILSTAISYSWPYLHALSSLNIAHIETYLKLYSWMVFNEIMFDRMLQVIYS